MSGPEHDTGDQAQPEYTDQLGAVRRRLQEIGQRADNATPGPWKVWAMDVLADPVGNSNREDGLHIAITADPTRGPRTFNADFIADARTDVPDLLAAVTAALAVHEPLLYDRFIRQTRDVKAAVSAYCPACRRPVGLEGCDTVKAIVAKLHQPGAGEAQAAAAGHPIPAGATTAENRARRQDAEPARPEAPC